MNRKEPIRMDRLRRVPEGFGWVDHRLVRDGHFENCDNEALALYLFLVTVGDERGVSWYSDKSLGRHLNLAESKVVRLRRLLVDAGLIAWRRPVCQVLSLDPSSYDNSRFAEALRESVRRERESSRRRRGGLCVMTPPAYRVPEDQGETTSLGDVIDDMLGEDGR